MVGGAVVGAVVPLALTASLRYSGLGLGVGPALGLVGWLGWRALSATSATEGVHPSLVALPMLLGALVTHFVDIQVGIPVTATETLFWVLAGVVASGWWLNTEDESLKTEDVKTRDAVAVASAPATRTGRARRPARSSASLGPQTASRPSTAPQSLVSSLALGLVGGLVMATLTYGFIVRGVNLAPSFVVLLSLGIVTLLGGAVLASGAGAFLGAASGVWVVYLIVHMLIALTNPNPGPPAFTLFVVTLLIWLLGFARADRRVLTAAETRVTSYASRLALGLPAVIVALVGMWSLSLQPVFADSFVRIGQLYSQLGRWNEAVVAFEEGMARAPTQDFFLPSVAQAYLAQAQTAGDPAGRQAAFERSRRVLREASRLSPRNPEYLVNLGAAEQYGAAQWTEGDTRHHLQDMAADKYKMAAALAPRDPHVLRRWGRLKLEQQQPAEAIPLLENALTLLLPDGATTVVLQTKQIVAEIRTDLARAYQAVGRTNDAIVQARTALTLAPDTARQPIEDLLKQLGAGGS
jgi:tetratricopeptide (TPR) repeat protein